MNAFEKLNKALGEYYLSQNVNDYYNEETPEGKFLAYCEENGFELDDVDEELENDPADCIYCDFDEAFPLDPSIKADADKEEERLAEIFKVIKYCHYNEKAPKYLNALKLDLITTADDLKSAETRYSAQCPKIFLQSQEETLKEVFAIGLKNDFPFISYLVDAYQRDRMLSAGKDLTAATWAKESPYIKNIASKSKKQGNTIESGIETYMKRVAPRFHWKAMNKIEDDLKPIIKYFITAGQFVDSLLERQTPPFGYDVVIVVKNAVSSSRMVMPDLSGTDDDDEDDEDDDDDDDDLKLNSNENTTQQNEKYLSNIEQRLSDNGCHFVRTTLNIQTKVGARFWMDTFRDFSKELEHNKYSGNKDDYDMSQYPRKKRFCTMIDRRGDTKEDCMIMFEPPDDSNTLPDQHVPDWYFNAGKTCIVPSKGYKDGVSGSSVPYDPQNTLCVDRAYKGQVLTISFHVDSSASIRCYLFWNGCYIRIVYPSDLKVVLNAIFDTTYNKNADYIGGKQCENDIAQLKVVDEDFDRFYKEVTMMKK